jgi:hypothetical protein
MVRLPTQASQDEAALRVADFITNLLRFTFEVITIVVRFCLVVVLLLAGRLWVAVMNIQFMSAIVAFVDDFRGNGEF